MKKFKQVLLPFLILLIWIYIGWRLFFTLPAGIALIPGILLLISEIILALQNTLFYTLLYKPNNRTTPTIPEEPYKVDVFITTYNESLEIVRRTILACKSLDYPKDYYSIWVCDDGRRDKMKKMAHSLDVGYITRNNNNHAKAGNLNNALKWSKGELVVTLDADMIPKPNFLKNTIGYFADEEVAFVQMPQSFYNDDIYQYNLIQSKNIPNEQDLFMRVIQAGRDRFNAIIYIGSNTVFRRRALESIGGFATGTITEDMATGMLLQSKGYKTVFHNEVLAQGLAAESLSDFLGQRVRWARGTIQTMRKWNPITLPGLTVMQRLLYLSSLIYWYFGIFKLIFILAPIVYLIFGIPSLQASLTGILIFWMPYFLVSSIVETVFLEKRMKRFWSNIYETSVAPFLAPAVLLETLTKRHIPFKVTPKGIVSQRMKINFFFAFPHLILLGLSITALIMGLIRYWNGDKEGTIINLFWLIYNLIIIIPTVLLSIERPKFRQTERFKRKFSVEMLLTDNENKKPFATTIDISEMGCSLFVNSFIELPEKLDIVIHGNYSKIETLGSVVYYDTYKSGYKIGLSFAEMDTISLQLWIRELYGEIPEESTFQYKSKTDMVRVLTHYFKILRIPLRRRVRRSPRMSIHLDCKVVGLPVDTLLAIQEGAASLNHVNTSLSTMEVTSNATIRDISLNGCKIEVNDFPIKHGDTIGVFIPQVADFFIGEVVRIEKQNGLVTMGVKWKNSESGRRIVEKNGAI